MLNILHTFDKIEESLILHFFSVLIQILDEHA